MTQAGSEDLAKVVVECGLDDWAGGAKTALDVADSARGFRDGRRAPGHKGATSLSSGCRELQPLTPMSAGRKYSWRPSVRQGSTGTGFPVSPASRTARRCLRWIMRAIPVALATLRCFGGACKEEAFRRPGYWARSVQFTRAYPKPAQLQREHADRSYWVPGVGGEAIDDMVLPVLHAFDDPLRSV